MAKMLEVVRESNRAAVRRASINQAKPAPAPDARKNRRKAPISVLNALEQLIEQPKPNADVRGLDESSRLPENSVSEMELVVSDASFGADDQQLSVVDELPDKEDNCSSRLNERMNKAKQYIEEEIKTVDIDFTPELARPSPAAAPKLLPQKPISLWHPSSPAMPLTSQYWFWLWSWSQWFFLSGDQALLQLISRRG